MFIYCGLLHAEESSKHLFILSGQSNMARFKPKSWFTPGISESLGAENVIVSFHAQGGQPISKWYKQWKSSKGETDPEAGKIYDALIETTQAAIQGSKIQTVTFIWMQGEADSKAQNSDVYLASLNGLKKQLEQDLKRTDLNFIIGRLSDSGFYRRRDKKRVKNPEKKPAESKTKVSTELARRMLQKNLEKLLLNQTESCKDVISQLTGTMTAKQVEKLAAAEDALGCLQRNFVDVQ